MAAGDGLGAQQSAHADLGDCAAGTGVSGQQRFSGPRWVLLLMGLCRLLTWIKLALRLVLVARAVPSAGRNREGPDGGSCSVKFSSPFLLHAVCEETQLVFLQNKLVSL